MEAWRRSDPGINSRLEKHYELFNYWLRQDRPAQGDRVQVVGVATGKIKATNKPFKDERVFDITVRNGKLTRIREYIDTQALARASQMDSSGLA